MYFLDHRATAYGFFPSITPDVTCISLITEQLLKVFPNLRPDVTGISLITEQLPKGFSQTLQAEEERKSKPRFEPVQQQDARAGPPATIVPAVPIVSELTLTMLSKEGWGRTVLSRQG